MSTDDGDSPGRPDQRAIAVAVEEALVPAVGASGVRSTILLEISSLERVIVAFGPEVGLGVMRCCADHLMVSAHPGDQVTRFTDSSFVVWCPHTPDSTEAHAYGEHLRRRLGRPSGMPHVGEALQVCAGVAVATADVCDAADLLEQSRTALLRARPQSTTKLYDSAMRDALLRRVELESIVATAIERGTVDLAYEPIVRLDDQRTVGAEAVVRVVDGSGASVPPAELVRAAEQSGQIDEFGDLILHTACTAAALWRRQAPGCQIQLAVDLSGVQLDDPILPQRVAASLDASGLDAGSLCLEITESALMRNPTRSQELLVALKARGVRLAADDFGTGCSSLAYLRTFPLDALKLDRSFVTAMPGGHQEVAITRAVVAIADALGMDVIADGIERHDQRECVASLGASSGQGCLWSSALPAAAFGTRLTAEA